MLYNIVFTLKYLQVSIKSLPLYCVFHSIRFKVNKIGAKRCSFFYAHNPKQLPLKLYLCQPQTAKEQKSDTALLVNPTNSHPSVQTNAKSTTQTFNICYIAWFIRLNTCRFQSSPYLCTVFFIVLDLRLTRLEQSVAPFFMSIPQKINLRSPLYHSNFP